MPDPTPRLGSLADTAPAAAPRMMSGQFPDQILDPAIRKLGWRFGVVPDREALRGRLEQEVGFADYGKYTREQLIEGLRLLQRMGGQTTLPDGTVLRPEDIGDLAERVRRRFPEPGPQSGLPKHRAVRWRRPTQPQRCRPTQLQSRSCGLFPRPFPRGCTRS